MSLLRGSAQDMPFATARALTRTAQAVRDHVTTMLDQRIDRPTAFTRRAYRISAARKTALVARVFAAPIQAAYLSRLEDGGEKAQPGLLAPVRAKTDASGNLGRRSITRASRLPGAFVGSLTNKDGNSQPGVYQRLVSGRPAKPGSKRKGRPGVRLLIAFISKRTHKPQLNFRKDAVEKANEIMQSELRRSIDKVFKDRK
ncbi:MAG: hypothetical protein ACT6Q8_24345 [Niveispirillum sp.]|uniref:hypothetical protein n=1 Tax=Niveispirillum sp. TaxID=1917217 RepID=UPI0040355E07